MLNKIFDYIKKYKYILIIVILIIIIIILSILYMKNVTKVEKMKVTEVSDDVMIAYDYYDTEDTKEIDKYIMYAIKYNYINAKEEKISIKEVQKIISKTFTKKISKKEIIDIGMTQYLVENNITYDESTETFFLNMSKNKKKDIANTKLTFYLLNKINKFGKTYTLTYEKYTIANPYEILNYYNNLNDSQKEKILKSDNVNTDDILDYLNGEKSKKVLIKYVNKEMFKDMNIKSKTVKVKYTIKGDSILIK